MSWEFHRAKVSFAQYAADWDRLNDALYANHPFFDSRFVGPLIKYFSGGTELLCLYREQGVVSGALILQPRGAGRWVSFRPSQAQITPILLRDAGLLKELMRALPGFAWSLELHAVDPRYAPIFSCTRGETIISTHATTIGVAPEQGFDSYWNQRPKNLKANIRRYYNRLEREDRRAALTFITEPEAMSDGVRRFGDLETAGWKSVAGTAVSINNVQGKFYAEVLANFALTGQAKICEMAFSGQLAASRLLVRNQKMLIILKTTYDESLARFAPGRLMLHRLLDQQLHKYPDRTIEFYTNATRDQTEWANFEIAIQNVHLFRNVGSVIAFSLLKTLLRQLARPSKLLRTNANAESPVTTDTCHSVQELIAGGASTQGFAPENDIEASLEWFDLLQKNVYPDDRGVCYHFVIREGRATAILPVREIRCRGVRTVESLSNYYSSLYAPLISGGHDPAALRYLLSSVTSKNRDHHVMRFAPMDPNSPEYADLLRELHAAGWLPLTFFCFGNWYLKVEGGWEDYLRKRSSNLRSSLKRRNREFAAKGGTLELVFGTEGLNGAIDAFQEVYSASWKKPEPYPEFVPSLIRLLAAKGMLRLGIARLHGQAVAAQLWIVGKRKASIYKVAYHHEFAALSPGTVLTSFLLRHVIEHDDVTEVDFLIGDDEYKKIWMSDRRERWGIVAFNPRTVIGCTLLIKELAGRIAKLASQRIEARLSNALNKMRGDPSPGRNLPNTQESQKDKTMIWTVLPVEKFSEYVTQWDNLARSIPGTPFLESAFLQPLLEVFGTGQERLCMLQENGQLRAASIMQPARTATWQTFQPSQLPLGAWISDGHTDLAAASSSLLLQLPGLVLGVGASQMDPLLIARPEQTGRLRTQDYIATAWVDIEGSFEAYWDGRGKNLKQNTRKQRNKLQSEGVIPRLECITSAEQVAGAIADYGQLESAGWKGADGTAIAAENAQGQFYRSMLENFCARGRGRIYRYWFDDKVVAMDLCIHDDVALVVLKTAYDESFRSVSPSTLMRQEQFQQLFEEQKFRRIEFFGKIMEWHTRWTSQSRTIYHATAYRWAWLKALQVRRTEGSAEPASD